jgi:hypothetical protein
VTARIGFGRPLQYTNNTVEGYHTSGLPLCLWFRAQAYLPSMCPGFESAWELRATDGTSVYYAMPPIGPCMPACILYAGLWRTVCRIPPIFAWHTSHTEAYIRFWGAQAAFQLVGPSGPGN